MPRVKSDEFVKEIGVLIRLRRKSLNLTQNDVAAPLDVTPQQIGKYERGEDQIKVGLLAELAAVLKVEITELLPARTTGFAEEDGPGYAVAPPVASIMTECRNDVLAALDRADARLVDEGFVRPPPKRR